jgi:hypothetical protein
MDFFLFQDYKKKNMNDDAEIPSIFNNSRTTDNPPLFTCSLKLDKYDYEKKVGDLYIIFNAIIRNKVIMRM